jgi:hypothetical protein
MLRRPEEPHDLTGICRGQSTYDIILVDSRPGSSGGPDGEVWWEPRSKETLWRKPAFAGPSVEQRPSDTSSQLSSGPRLTTRSAYPQVDRGLFASFPVAKSSFS